MAAEEVDSDQEPKKWMDSEEVDVDRGVEEVDAKEVDDVIGRSRWLPKRWMIAGGFSGAREMEKTCLKINSNRNKVTNYELPDQMLSNTMSQPVVPVENTLKKQTVFLKTKLPIYHWHSTMIQQSVSLLPEDVPGEEDEYDFLLLATAATIVMTAPKKRKRVKKTTWCRKWLQRKAEGQGVLTMLNEELLSEDPASYRNFLRLTSEQFDILLAKIGCHITRQDTVMRESISLLAKHKFSNFPAKINP
ncbi:hypothetical protein FQA39_LY16003 [Lamprigera yunnana]|nr:hypothetical protein FQA39_LY16003 [Lamprigera yunnana]